MEDGDERTPPTEVATEREFQAALRGLVEEAESNGVDVRGGWLGSTDSDDVWGVEITDLSGRSTAHAPEGSLAVPSVTEAVTAREDVDATDLPPLYDAIDTELLELLYDSAGDGPEQYLTFEYAGYRITACSDGSIVVDE